MGAPKELLAFVLGGAVAGGAAIGACGDVSTANPVGAATAAADGGTADGGDAGGNATADAAALAGHWRTSPSLPRKRFEAFGATIGGKIYFVGGITGVQDDIASVREVDWVEIWDPATS